MAPVTPKAPCGEINGYSKFRLLFTSLLLSTTGVSAAKSQAPYELTLKNIYSSHGALEPPFSPSVFDYTINLQHAQDEIALTPEVFKNRTEYMAKDEEEQDRWPVITIHWPGHEDEPEEATAVAVRKQVDLPDDKSTMTVNMHVANPDNAREYVDYHVTIYQSSDPLTVLKHLSGVDDSGNTVLIQPVTTQDSLVYSAYVHPDATSVTFNIRCATSDWLAVDDVTQDNGGFVTIARDLTRHKQFLELTCGEGLVQQTFVRYVLEIMSDYPVDQIARPRVIIEDTGKDCQYHPPKDEDAATDPGFFNCPDPKAKTGRTKVIGFSDPTVRYTIESPDGDVQVRLLHEIPTIPFTYRTDLMLIGSSGRFNQTWPLHFNARLLGNTMKAVGWLMAGLLIALMIGTVGVLAFANMFGLGSPVGSSEVTNSLIFVSQYFCFANYIRGSSVLENMTEGLKWTTGYAPLPWESGIKMGASITNKFQNFAESGSHDVGDISDIHNAYGSLFYCGVIMLLCFLFHGGVMLKFVAFESENTFPHRLLFGHWETRVLHILAFPLFTSSCMIIWSRHATLVWKILSIGAIAIYAMWEVSAFFLIRQVVADKKVSWVWSSSVREDGELEDESGYWSDVICDQLNTQPVNRSLFKSSFPWTWVSTVADVESTNILPQYFNRGSSAIDDDESVISMQTLHPHKEFRKDTSYPMAKTAKTVEVYRTRAPGIFCPGQRLIAGLLRSQWLDILFTFQGLSRFHSEVARDVDDFVVPLTVKTCQLQGPITTGRYCFYFDGARVPIIRIMDGVFKASFGACMGLAMAAKRPMVDFICFSVAAAVALASLSYVLSVSPYSRKSENWLVVIVLGAVSLACISFAITSMFRKLTVLQDIFLWTVALVCIVVAIYSCVVTFSMFSAVCCAPLEETRFLEKLANCTATIADHTEGWSVDMPAYNKYGARDFKAQVNHSDRKVHVSVYPSREEPVLEFDMDDIKQACKTGTLRNPVLSLFAPAPDSALSYRHLNVYDKGNAGRQVAEFLSHESSTRSAADQIARQIALQLESRGRDRTVVCATVIPPREGSGTSLAGSEYGGSSLSSRR